MVEKVSRYSGLDEREVASRAVRLATQSGDPGNAHVAWYLLSGGLGQLELETRARIPLGISILRFASRHANRGLSQRALSD